MPNSQDRLMLPWSVEQKESNVFRLIISSLLVVLLVLSIWIPSIKLPEPDRETLEKLPPQLAKLVVKKAPPKPVKKEPVKEEPKKEEPKKEPEKKQPEKKPKKEPPKKQVEKKPPVKKQSIKQAREVARKTGLLALQNDLAELKSSVDVNALKKQTKKARVEQTIAAKAKSVSSEKVLETSGGIQANASSVPAESIKLDERQLAQLDETLDEKDLALAEEDAARKAQVRSADSIRLAIEQLKEALHKLYNRELRKDPFLEGVVSFEVVIEANGEVSYCRIIESALSHTALEKKFVNRIRLHNFGAEDVGRISTQINIDFQPK